MKPPMPGVNRANPNLVNSADLRRLLKAELSSANCFAPAPLQQTLHIIALFAAYAAGYALLLTDPGAIARVATLALLAFVSVQAGFVAHEAGHGAITRKRWVAVAIGQFLNTFLTALCYSHFQKIHVCHHRHCNNQDRDIDMQSAIFSLYPDAKQHKSTAFGRFITRYQAYLIWPLVTLQGFSLKVDSLKTLYQNPRKTRTDQVVLLLHFALWFGLPVHVLGFADALLNYALMTWFIGPYLGSVFLVNHIGTHEVRTADRMNGFMQQLATTRNLGDSRFADFLSGGMNNHIEHHMFPSIPSVRLRKARPIVEAFCRRHSLEYRKTRWLPALRDVFVYLRDISRQPLPLAPQPAEQAGWKR